MVTVFGILNLTEDSFFDESRRLDPAGAVTAAIEMLRVGSDVVDVGPAASHPDARPVSPADEIRRIAPQQYRDRAQGQEILGYRSGSPRRA